MANCNENRAVCTMICQSNIASNKILMGMKILNNIAHHLKRLGRGELPQEIVDNYEELRERAMIAGYNLEGFSKSLARRRIGRIYTYDEGEKKYRSAVESTAREALSRIEKDEDEMRQRYKDLNERIRMEIGNLGGESA